MPFSNNLQNSNDEQSQFKFDNCKWRSTVEEEIGEFSCCTNNLHMGYICWRRNIEDLQASHCSECSLYKIKNNL